MKYRIKNLLAVFLVLTVLVTLVSSCGSKGTDTTNQSSTNTQEQKTGGTAETDVQNPITFTVFTASDDPLKGDAPILQEVAKKTGVTFDFQDAAGQTSEKLSIMLASNDYTDVVMMPRDNLFYQYLESGDLVDLKPLLQEHAPNVYQTFNLPENGSLIDRFTDKNGKLYYLTNDLEVIRSGEKPAEDLEAQDYVEQVLPWHRMLFTLYPEIQDVYGKKINSMDNLYEALKSYKQKYPDKDHYPISMSSTMGGDMLWAGLAMNGYKVLSYGIYGGVYATKDGQKYQYAFKEPEILDFFKYLNRFYREGLMDQEGPIQTDEQFQQKLNTGKVFSMIGSFLPIYDANANFVTADETKSNILIPQKLLAPDVKNQWQFNYAYTGNNAMVVTNKCKDPARFTRFLNWLYSDEGLVLSGWGIEGEEYVIKDGKRDVTPEINAKIQADPDYYLKRGLGIFYNIVNWPVYTSDGQRSTLEYAPFYTSEDGKDPRDVAVTNSPFNWHNDWGGTFWKDYDEVDIYSDAQSPEAQALAQAQALVNDAVCKMILAGSTQTVEQIYKETVSQMETVGISKWEKLINDEIASRRSK
ncbi:MAG TPA: extracellular solute-binding protein [Ruminiclostridium sp.]